MMSVKKSLKNKLSLNQLRIIYFFRQNIWYINWFKTIYFNLRVLPLKNACKLPFIIGHHVRLRSIGKVEIGCNIETALVTIGVIHNDWEDVREGYVIFDNKGVITFNGLIKFHPGVKLYNKGVLEFGGFNTIGARTFLICFKEIVFGKNTGCSWDCSFADTNFHPLKDLIANHTKLSSGKISLGDNVFIGNHCSFSNKTVIPNGCVISAYSKVSGSFKKEGENLLIASSSATILDKGYQMIDFNRFPPVFTEQ